MGYEDYDRGCGEGPARSEGDKNWWPIDFGIFVVRLVLKVGGSVPAGIGFLIRIFHYDPIAARNLAERAQDIEENRPTFH